MFTKAFKYPVQDQGKGKISRASQQPDDKWPP